MTVLDLEQRGSTAWLWLNRPERLNALDEPLLDAVHEAFLKLNHNEAVRVIVLAGRGRAFCSGFDIHWMAERTPETVRADRVRLRALFDTLERSRQPVICAVQGVALGGGLILALISDMILASAEAKFGAPEVRIGIFPSLGLVPRLERAVGIRAAKYLTISGQPIDAQEALRLGLINQISADLYNDTQRLAEHIAGLPATAVSVTKSAFSAHPLPDYAAWETDHAVECWSAPERAVAMQAFLDKRK